MSVGMQFIRHHTDNKLQNMLILMDMWTEMVLSSGDVG